MVATRGHRRKQPAQEEEAQPPITDYERSRDIRVAENLKKMQEIGLLTLAADFNNSLPQLESTKGKKSANKKTNSSDSDSSEYLLEDDDHGDSDDDDTESDEQPQLLAVQYTTSGRRKTLASKKRKTNMAPGSRSKRVRASDQSEVHASGAQTRSSKRVQTAEIDGDIPDSSTTPRPADHDRTPRLANHDREPANAEEDSGAAGLGSTAAALDCTAADEDIVAQDEGTEGTAQRAPRRPRCPTKGKQLDKMTKAMARRLPIVVEQGKKRPHEPVQAAKFASEAGIVIRESMPVLTHWKEYKKTDKYYNDFVGDLSGRLAIKKDDKPTEEAVTDMLRSAVKNQRYRLKQKYFNGIPANEVRTTSPVPYMTDVQWKALVGKWSDPKNMETCEKNKRNRSKVKYHQATGSRCYVAHLHAYKQKRNREEPSAEVTEELDAVEAFQTCHTSSKKGLTEPAREALHQMEALRSEPVAEGVAPASSVEVVSKVLPQNSSHHFLKSVGIKKPASSKSSSSNESELREQLAAEAAAAVQVELDELKKKSQEAEEQLARTQSELEEYKRLTEKNTKEMEENNLILKKLLSLHGNASSST